MLLDTSQLDTNMYTITFDMSEKENLEDTIFSDLKKSNTLNNLN